MNYKTMLLATAAVFVSTQAMAADITGAFAVPGEGQFLADTRIGHERATSRKHTEDGGVDKATYVSEVIEYGLTNAFSVNLGIANNFDAEGDYNNDHNWGYQLGAKYNTNFDKVLFQVAGTYYTENPKDFHGHRYNDKERGNRWEKEFIGQVKLGYDMGDGLTPYVTYLFDSELDKADRDLGQSVSLGLHKYTGEYALDGALRYDFSTDGKNSDALWFDVAADYYLKDNVVLGAYGSYLLHGTGDMGYNHEQDYAYEAGVHVKVLF